MNAVLYDDHCPLCTFQSRMLTWLDWRNVIRMVPISDPQSAVLVPHLTRHDLLEAIHCVTPDNRVYRGARAIRYLSLRMPLLVPLGLFLWIPGVIWFAERAYQFVSRNRHVLSRLFGCKGACALLPERSRPAAPVPLTTSSAAVGHEMDAQPAAGRST